MLRSEIKKQAQRLLHKNYGRWSTLVMIPFICMAIYLFFLMVSSGMGSYATNYNYGTNDGTHSWRSGDSLSGTYEDGYQDGYNEGYESGYEDGLLGDSFFGDWEPEVDGYNLQHQLNTQSGLMNDRSSRRHNYDYDYTYQRTGSGLFGSFIGFLLFLAVLLITILYQGLIKWAAVANVAGESFGLKETFGKFFKENGKRAVTGNLLVFLFTFLWSLLFIVPGIVKQLSYSMTNYLMSRDEQLTVKEAIALSMELMSGYKMEYFIFTLSFFFWQISASFTMGISLFYVTPYYNVSEVLFFDQIIEEKRHLFSNELEAGFTDF